MCVLEAKLETGEEAPCEKKQILVYSLAKSSMLIHTWMENGWKMDGKWGENGGKHYEIFTYKSGWWSLTDFFIFTPDPWGFMIQFD